MQSIGKKKKEIYILDKSQSLFFFFAFSELQNEY